DVDSDNSNRAFFFECVDDLILLLAPLVPHVAEELNEKLGNRYSVFKRPYPTCNEKALVRDEYELAVQVNSRMKAKIVVPNGANDEQITSIATSCPAVIEAIGGGSIVKTVIIPNRLVNIVVKQ
ncbi:MAG: class I tRNA ligase family protein, partial [Clostridia bacterium]